MKDAPKIDDSIVVQFVAEQRDYLADLGFKSPLISLTNSRADVGIEFDESHVVEATSALMAPDGRLQAQSSWCCGAYSGESFAQRLRHIAMNAEALESDIGANLLKFATVVVVWLDQDRKEREAPIFLRSVRLIGDEWVAEGSVEINDTFLMRMASAGLLLEIDQARVDLASVKKSSDPSGIFVRVKERAVIDLFSTVKLALWKRLDASERPGILHRGALRLLAGAGISSKKWSVKDENIHLVAADPTQDRVISAARRGESFLVQGPPGTGKSQTITNVVANLIKDGRTVLVAAAKVAAIEVVAARLQKMKAPCQLLLGPSPSTEIDASVILTTPANAARYLPPDRAFDMIIVDEASQMPLPNALSLATRADRIIVVGDPMQLGPNLRAYEPTATSTKITELPSLLDQCAAIGLPEFMLKQHYRSLHPDLIFFSNVFSYGSKLLTSPHPALNQDFGVFLYRLLGVTSVEEGGSVTNRHEAAAITDLILRNLDEIQEKHLSLGVIVPNRAQRDLVASLLARELAERRIAPKALSQKPEEAFFVRMVDDVQGEERDVVIFGLTYARKANGQLPRQLGPFSDANGLARINVAMSRARIQTYVISSLQETDLEPARLASHALFVALLRAADCYVEPYFLPATHRLTKMADQQGCLVQVVQGIFGFLRKDRRDHFVLGLYLKGLRDELEDAAELSRLKNLGWRLEIIEGLSARKHVAAADYFASWNWPIDRIASSLNDAVIASGI